MTGGGASIGRRRTKGNCEIAAPTHDDAYIGVILVASPISPLQRFSQSTHREREETGCYPECLRLSRGQAEKLGCTKGNSRILSCLPSAESNYARATWQPLPAKLLPIIRQPHRRHLQNHLDQNTTPTNKAYRAYYKRLSAVAGSKVRLCLSAIARVEAMMCRRVRGGTVRRRPIAESKR